VLVGLLTDPLPKGWREKYCSPDAGAPRVLLTLVPDPLERVHRECAHGRRLAGLELSFRSGAPRDGLPRVIASMSSARDR
jgi:hypothetical protein